MLVRAAAFPFQISGPTWWLGILVFVTAVIALIGLGKAAESNFDHKHRVLLVIAVLPLIVVLPTQIVLSNIHNSAVQSARQQVTAWVAENYDVEMINEFEGPLSFGCPDTSDRCYEGAVLDHGTLKHVYVIPTVTNPVLLASGKNRTYTELPRR